MISGGSYIPSFFEMKLETSDSLDLSKTDDISRSVFIHEYVHFLQDITTTYGLYNIYANGEFVLSCVKQITSMPKGDFDTPINFEENQDNIKLQITVNELTIGETELSKKFIPKFRIKKIGFIKSPLIVDNEYLDEIEQAIIHADNLDIHFGAREIQESMAFLVQKACCADCPEHDEFPYHSATKVAGYYSSHFARSPRKVLALCEMSLMTSNPGKTFCRTMEQVRSKQLKFDTVYDIYYHFSKLKLQEAGTNKLLSIKDGYQQIAGYAFDHFLEYFRGEKLFEPVMNWVKTLNDFGKTTIRNDEHIYISILDCFKKDINLSYINGLINLIGGPLMKNDKGERFAFPNMPDLSPISALYQIYQILKYGTNRCELKQWCSSSINNNVTKDCSYSPWLRSETGSTMCPFSMLWHKWGLSGHLPV